MRRSKGEANASLATRESSKSESIHLLANTGSSKIWFYLIIPSVSLLRDPIRRNSLTSLMIVGRVPFSILVEFRLSSFPCLHSDWFASSRKHLVRPLLYSPAEIRMRGDPHVRFGGRGYPDPTIIMPLQCYLVQLHLWPFLVCGTLYLLG
jgi:hypothetical protein